MSMKKERFIQRRRMAPVAQRTPHLQKVQRSTLRALRESKLCSKNDGVAINGCIIGGIRKNTNMVKNPVEGKFLADLDWTRIIVNPVDGSVLCMDSKRLQDLGAKNVTLDEVYGIPVVIYAWKFI